MAPRILAGTKSSAGTTRMCSDTVRVCACGCLCVWGGGGGVVLRGHTFREREGLVTIASIPWTAPECWRDRKSVN